MNLIQQAYQQIKDKPMTPEQVFAAGWQAALAFQKANSDSKHSLERNVNMSVTPLGRFASGAG